MLLWFFAAFLAYFVKGVSGFANTLVFTAVLALGGEGNISITPVDLLLGMPANLYLAMKNRKYASPKIYLPMIAAVLLGAIPGIFFLKNLDARWVRLLFGALILLLGLQSLGTKKRPAPAEGGRYVLWVIGLLSGLVTGLYGVGALLAAFFRRLCPDSRAFKGNMCVVFLAENLFRAAVYACTGILTPDALARAAPLLPLMGAGLWAGSACTGRMKESSLRLAVNLFLMLSGAALLVQAF